MKVSTAHRSRSSIRINLRSSQSPRSESTGLSRVFSGRSSSSLLYISPCNSFAKKHQRWGYLLAIIDPYELEYKTHPVLHADRRIAGRVDQSYSGYITFINRFGNINGCPSCEKE